ncbi:MAG: hypothetical protein E6300_06245 [Clostridium sp.]|uniref:hypothetical protein n=1 Tax=Clostridium sp. TaxID=1506 RepID=UPI001ECB6C3C|nr:hypothetical protein [Clostridium sp.]MBS5884037.1 hypothetical protein [Clostridium sp.]MDU7148072.1 hypothetical protein [Clostridium sp.]MDU7241165.1 hypothetical protein [Clostridium sp.]
MLNEYCFNNELEYKSLIFNAGTMNDAEETSPDTVPLGSANSSIRILGWLLPQGDTNEYSLTFSVPRDARRARRAKVFVHLLTDNSNTPIGNRFAIRLSSLFTRANGLVNIADLRTIDRVNIPIQNSLGNFQYNHYVLEFELNNVIRTEDFALLSVARIASNNDYAGALLLTSIEFRYLSN